MGLWRALNKCSCYRCAYTDETREIIVIYTLLGLSQKEEMLSTFITNNLKKRACESIDDKTRKLEFIFLWMDGGNRQCHKVFLFKLKTESNLNGIINLGTDCSAYDLAHMN